MIEKRSVLLSIAILSVAVGCIVTPLQAQDDYWRSHWNWFDDTYRPYQEYQYYGTSIGGGSYHAPLYYGRDGMPVNDHLYMSRRFAAERQARRSALENRTMRYGWW